MMRKITLLAVFAILAAAAIALAQPSTTAVNAPPATAVQKSGGTANPESKPTMDDLWAQTKRLSEDWGKLQEHYNKIMTMKDTSQQRFEMQKHQDMVTAYGNRMKSYENFWFKAMNNNDKGQASSSKPPQGSKAKLITPGSGAGNVKALAPKKELSTAKESPKVEPPKLTPPKTDTKSDTKSDANAVGK